MQRPIDKPMSLQPKTKRIIWVTAAVIVILLVLGALFTWTKFFREEKEVFANEEEHFKYGSLGAEGDRGIPYYLWMVLPRIFPELMPGPGGYKSLGVVWEEGHEIPVGFSKKVVGFARITNNCAVCHTATYRLKEDEMPHVVAAGPGTYEQYPKHAALFVQGSTRSSLQFGHHHE